MEQDFIPIKYGERKNIIQREKLKEVYNMKIGTKAISMKFGLVVLALGVVGYMMIQRRRN